MGQNTIVFDIVSYNHRAHHTSPALSASLLVPQPVTSTSQTRGGRLMLRLQFMLSWYYDLPKTPMCRAYHPASDNKSSKALENMTVSKEWFPYFDTTHTHMLIIIAQNRRTAAPSSSLPTRSQTQSWVTKPQRKQLSASPHSRSYTLGYAFRMQKLDWAL